MEAMLRGFAFDAASLLVVCTVLLCLFIGACFLLYARRFDALIGLPGGIFVVTKFEEDTTTGVIWFIGLVVVSGIAQAMFGPKKPASEQP